MQSQSQPRQQQMNTLPKLNKNIRTMPKWVTEEHDRVGPKPPAPPPSPSPSNASAKPPALPPKTSNQPEPDYEVIEFSGQQYSNEPLLKHNAAGRPKTPDAKHKCTLCGSSNPWVTCDQCAKQIFCASCDDMFHKHPKRKGHVRKSIAPNLPPIPPKIVPGQPGPSPPVAPPRRGKRGVPTPLMQRKDQVNINNTALIPPSPTPSVKNSAWHERVDSLKRGMSLSNRPLPDTPKPTTPSDDMSSRSTTPRSVFDGIQRPPSVTLEKIKTKANATLDRMAVLQQRYRQQKEERERNRSGSVTDQNLSFDQWSNISPSPSHFRSGSMSSGLNSSHFDLTEDSHFHSFHQRQGHQQQQQQPFAPNRNGSMGGRNMSTSVFNLNQINRRSAAENTNNSWMGSQMQQAQSMAQINCATCSHQRDPWNRQPQQPNHSHPENWNNQMSMNQHLNRSNLSLNVPAGFMMPPHQQVGMYPPPVFMNQRGMPPNMYPYPYPNMPVMHPGVMAMPPTSRSRVASRASSRVPSPTLSRKSISMRKKRSSYAETEPTDDEDSDQDDRRSLISNRSGMIGAPRTRQRRLSSVSQAFLDDESESNNQPNLISKIRDQRRGSIAKSVQNDWQPGRRASTNNAPNGEDNFGSVMKSSRIYSDLESEGSGTRALVQAKIQQKLEEGPIRKPKARELFKSESEDETPQKVAQKVQSEIPKTINILEENDNIYNNVPRQHIAVDSTEIKEQQLEEVAANEENEDEPLGPPPTTPDHEWECEFCTFVNEPKIKICTICCKTPSKPPAVPKLQTKPLEVSTAQNQKSSTTNGIQNGMDNVKLGQSEDASEVSRIKKKDSVEDIWAALNENIQATAGEVIRNATTKKKEKVSTGCGTSPPRDFKTSSEIIHTEAKEIGTSPPPQNISTQTYETLPIQTSKLTEQSIVMQEPNLGRTTMMTERPNIEHNIQYYPESTQQERYRSSHDLRNSDALPLDYTPLSGLGRRQSSIAELLLLQRGISLQAQSQMHPQSPVHSFQSEHSYYDFKPTRDPETELFLLIKEAELHRFTSEELHVALKHCGSDMHPIQWLRENWSKLIQTVQSLATKYGQERAENIIGTISQIEARDALRMHFGNIWQAVSECIEQRQRKYREISSKGNFSRDDIVTALTSHHGNVEAATLELSKTQLKPFLMRIWGSPGGVDNESGPNMQSSTSPQSPNDSNSIKSDIHDFLNANASECYENPAMTDAFRKDQNFQSQYSLNDHNFRLHDNLSTYSQDSKEHTSSPFQLDDSSLNNKNMLKDVETLIGNMEQNQAKKNEEVLRSIEVMLSNLINKKELVTDMNEGRIVMKSPINTNISKSSTGENNEKPLDVKNFVWQHIQEIVPDLVQQVEKELSERDDNDLDNNSEPIPVEPTEPVNSEPVNSEEYIMEEVIKPNLKYSSIREEVPIVFLYVSEIANFRMEYDRARDLEVENEFEALTLNEASRKVYKMFKELANVNDEMSENETFEINVISDVNEQKMEDFIESPLDSTNAEEETISEINNTIHIKQEPQEIVSPDVASNDISDITETIDTLVTQNNQSLEKKSVDQPTFIEIVETLDIPKEKVEVQPILHNSTSDLDLGQQDLLSNTNANEIATKNNETVHILNEKSNAKKGAISKMKCNSKTSQLPKNNQKTVHVTPKTAQSSQEIIDHSISSDEYSQHTSNRKIQLDIEKDKADKELAAPTNKRNVQPIKKSRIPVRRSDSSNQIFHQTSSQMQPTEIKTDTFKNQEPRVSTTKSSLKESLGHRSKDHQDIKKVANEQGNVLDRQDYKIQQEAKVTTISNSKIDNKEAASSANLGENELIKQTENLNGTVQNNELKFNVSAQNTEVNRMQNTEEFNEESKEDTSALPADNKNNNEVSENSSLKQHNLNAEKDDLGFTGNEHLRQELVQIENNLLTQNLENNSLNTTNSDENDQETLDNTPHPSNQDLQRNITKEPQSSADTALIYVANDEQSDIMFPHSETLDLPSTTEEIHDTTENTMVYNANNNKILNNTEVFNLDNELVDIHSHNPSNHTDEQLVLLNISEEPPHISMQNTIVFNEEENQVDLPSQNPLNIIVKEQNSSDNNNVVDIEASNDITELRETEDNQFSHFSLAESTNLRAPESAIFDKSTHSASEFPNVAATIGDVAESISEEETEIEATSESELYSMDSDTVDYISNRNQLKSPNSDTEMLLVIDNNQQHGSDMPNSSSATINSVSSNSSKQISANMQMKDFVPSSDPSKQNLSELVEDTQRLIKQMKDEINMGELESSEEEYTDDYSSQYDDESVDDEDWEEEEDEEEQEDEEDEDDSQEAEEDADENEEDSQEGEEEEDYMDTEYELENSVDVTNTITNDQENSLEIVEQDQLEIVNTLPISNEHNEITENTEIPIHDSHEELTNQNISNTHTEVHGSSASITNQITTLENDLINEQNMIQDDMPVIADVINLLEQNIYPDAKSFLDEDNTTIIEITEEVKIDNSTLKANQIEKEQTERNQNANVSNVVENALKKPSTSKSSHKENQVLAIGTTNGNISVDTAREKASTSESSNKKNQVLAIGMTNGAISVDNAIEKPSTSKSSNRVNQAVANGTANGNISVDNAIEKPGTSKSSNKENQALAIGTTNGNISSETNISFESIVLIEQDNSVSTDLNTMRIENTTHEIETIPPGIIRDTVETSVQIEAPIVNTLSALSNLLKTNSTTNNVNTETETMTQQKPKTKINSTTTNSKIPKPKATSNIKSKVPTRSKSFSGPPTPIGISSVKAIQQEYLSKQVTTVIPQKKTPPALRRKNSITDVITKLSRPSLDGPSTSKLFRSRTQPRIPKKKYHETCFSDDDYQTSSSEEPEPEPLEVRQRKQSVPVFRTYASMQETEEVNPQTLAIKYVDEKLVDNYAEAQIAATLVNMKFQQDVALWAAKECSDLEQAIGLLQRECELCMGIFALNQMVSMLKCTHKCCKQCAKTYFTVQITDRSINDCNCPFCKIPELHGQNQHEDENLEYFSNLDIFLKSILDTEVHELFQRKLRDRTLLQDPNFKWCIQCSSGFFARPKQKRLICPDCGSVTCSQCRKTWEKQHEGISCEKYLEWKEANDPEVQAQGVQEHLALHGIDCPKCKFRYSLARGGCMHFTCTQCKFEFCYGCAKPFMMGAKCNISPYCAKLGLHAHHPRNCLFYLRDKIPLQLQFLLKENGVVFDVDLVNSQKQNAVTSNRCPIQLQKETPKGLVDATCNADITDKQAGLCRTHYVEYLSAKVAKARIDPLPIFDLTDCVQELRRRGIALPERGPWDTDEIYKNMCSEIIKQQIPLESE